MISRQIRKYFRRTLRSVWILVGLIGLFVIFALLILHHRLDDRNINWIPRPGINGESPNGRSLHHIHNASSVNLSFNNFKPAIYRKTLHTRHVSVVIAGDGVGGGVGDGRNLKVLISAINRNNAINVSQPLKPNMVGFNDGTLVTSNSHLGCDEIATLTLHRRIGRGTTKDVYSSMYKDKMVAVKMVSPKVQDIKACLRRKMFRNEEECYTYANYKIMKEIALAQQLHHPNIVKVRFTSYVD